MIIDELFEGPQLCPECGGISFSDLILAEKKDACYYKVKASAKVWPSAYASGRLVQCRKKGAANYGNKSEGVAEGSSDTVYPNAEVIKSKNGKPVGEIYQDGNSWGCFHYKADRGYDFIDSREEAIEALKDLHQETGRSRPDYTVKGVAEQQELDEKWSQKYKSSINCANPRGFSQKAHCAGRNKNEDVAEGALDDSNFGKSAALMTPSPQAAQQAKDIVQKQADANVISQAKIAGAAPVTHEGEQQKGADYRDPKEVDYDDEYDAMVARVKRLAGLGPMKTVYDPNKRQYRNMPTAVQPKK
jgi:hypothetical protein